MAKRGSSRNNNSSSSQNAVTDSHQPTFLKHFHSGISNGGGMAVGGIIRGDSGSTTGYKQLRGTYQESPDAQTVVADELSPTTPYDATHPSYGHQSSPTSLATVSGTLGANSGNSSGNSPNQSSTNPFRTVNSTSNTATNNVSNSNFRSASTLNNNSTAHLHAHNHNHHQQQHNTSPQYLSLHHNTSSGGQMNISGGGGGHYASNLQNVSSSGGTKKTTSLLLDPSRVTSTGQTQVLHSTASPLSLGETTASSSSMLVQQHPNPSSNHLRSSSNCTTCTAVHWGGGLRENLASLALMCILSLLMAFLALFFLQRSCPLTLFPETPEVVQISGQNHSKLLPSATNRNVALVAGAQLTPNFNQRLVANNREYLRVFQISVCLSTLTIALNLCCLFVCAIQFLSIVKLLKTPFGVRRAGDFIKRTSHIRVLSFGAFLVSIPIFFTGVILYTFVNFDEVPALVTSLIIGLGIIFCGVASVQNVYLWQWEKTKASQDLRHSQAAMHIQLHQQQQQLQQQQQSLSAGHLSQSHQLQPQSQHPHHHPHLHQQQITASNYPLELSTLV